MLTDEIDTFREYIYEFKSDKRQEIEKIGETPAFLDDVNSAVADAREALNFAVRYLGVMPRDITIMATQADFNMIITIL